MLRYPPPITSPGGIADDGHRPADVDRLRHLCLRREAPAKPLPVAIAGTVVPTPTAGPRRARGSSTRLFKGGGSWGKVVARTETDVRGQFRLEVPVEPDGRPEPGMLWAYRPGDRALVAAHRINRETLPPDWPVAMVLDEPARAEILVRGPDGRPVAGARIQPRALHHEPFVVPDGLAERIEAQTLTDARGRAVLSAFFPEEIDTVIVAAPGLGRQYFSLDLIDGNLRGRRRSSLGCRSAGSRGGSSPTTRRSPGIRPKLSGFMVLEQRRGTLLRRAGSLPRSGPIRKGVSPCPRSRSAC